MKTFNLKEETINNVLNYLAKQPYADVINLIGSIQKECQPQVEQPKQEVVD